MAESQDARPVGAVIEVIERRREPAPDVEGADLIVPTEIRVNGQRLLTPKGHPVKVHQITLSEFDAVLVTLTVFAKRVVIGAEDAEASDA